MRGHIRFGFTLIEVLVAVVLLVVGVLALVGTLGAATRLVGRGRHVTLTGAAGTSRLERLRGVATATSPSCADPEFGSGTEATEGFTEQWSVPATGIARRIILTLEHRDPAGRRWDTLHTTVLCP